SGAIIGVVLVFRDVTEQRRSMAARTRLAAIVESSDDAIFSEDLDEIILTWNRGAERLYGYSADEIVGRQIGLLVPPESRDELAAIMERIKRGERIEHFETTRVRRDGSRVDVSLTISPLKDAAGNVVAISKIARDMTDRRRREASLRFLAEASKILSELLDEPTALEKITRLSVTGFADWCTIDLVEDGDLRRVAVAHVDRDKLALAEELKRDHP